MNRVGSDLILVSKESTSYSAVEEQFDLLSQDGAIVPVSEWPSSRALRGIFVTDEQVKFRRKETGEVGSRQITTRPAPGRRGKQGQVVVGYRDLTALDLSDKDRSRLAAIVESSADSITSTDMRGLVTTWNGGAKKVYGYLPEEMLGQSITRLLTDEASGEEEEILERIRNGEAIENRECIRRRKDGRHIHISLTVSPLRDASGRVIGASRVARDMTRTRNLERQLQQAQKMEAIGQLTGGIAHDFNNLLGIVIGNLDLLESLVETNPPALDRTRTAHMAAARCADLTKRLLAFSATEQLSPRAISLNDSIRNVMAMATRALGPEIRVELSLTEDLPHIYVDPSGLESAVLNLAVNARDAMLSGGTLKISTRIVSFQEADPAVVAGKVTPGNYAQISISDNGHGMSKETLNRAFEPFFTTKERGRGTGLGLAMVYGFARQSNGSALIYSEEGYGTTVTLLLPFASGHTSPNAVATFSAVSNRPGGTILLVDDEQALLDIASTFLHKLGYQTLRACDAAHALRVMESCETVDLMITDIIMPGGMNGVELAQRVKTLHPSTRIIYTSGFPADALADKKVELQNHMLLNKPYRLVDLGAAVSRALSEPQSVSMDTGTAVSSP